MKFSFKNNVILGLVLSFTGSYLFAKESVIVRASCSSGSAVTVKGKEVSLSSIPKGAKVQIVVSPKDPICKGVLDIWWDHREDLQNQKVIANYLSTKPKVPNDFEISWKTARLVYFIGNYGYGENNFVNTKAGAELFHYGAEAGKQAMKLEPNRVEGYYWYAIDLGSYGLAKGIIASAANAKEGMRALAKAMSIDPKYQWYGSSRILGRYYQELPGLFGGDKEKALQLMKSATEKAPEFRNNWEFLGKYYLSRKEYDKALVACNTALEKKSLDGKYEEARYIREAQECRDKAQEKLK